MAMRAKTPIFDDDGKIIGVVSIGYLISKIDSWRSDFLLPMAGVFILLLLVLMLLSGYLPPIFAGRCWGWSLSKSRG